MYLGQHKFSFNDELELTTKFYDNGDSVSGTKPSECIYCIQHLTLQNSSSLANFELMGRAEITPDSLRKLANELEQQQNLFESQLLKTQLKHGSITEIARAVNGTRITGGFVHVLGLLPGAIICTISPEVLMPNLKFIKPNSVEQHSITYSADPNLGMTGNVKEILSRLEQL